MDDGTLEVQDLNPEESRKMAQDLIASLENIAANKDTVIKQLLADREEVKVKAAAETDRINQSLRALGWTRPGKVREPSAAPKKRGRPKKVKAAAETVATEPPVE